MLRFVYAGPVRVAIAVLTAGCSMLGVKRVPPRPRQESLECTDSYMAPVLDVGIAVGGIALAVADKSCGGENGPGFCFGPYIGTGLGVLAALVAVPSAFYGFNEVHKCRDARQELELTREQPARDAAVATARAEQESRDACVRTRDRQYAEISAEPDTARRADLVDHVVVCDNANARVWVATIALARRALNGECDGVAAYAKTMRETDGTHYERVLLANPDIAGCVQQVRENCMRARAAAQRQAMELTDLDKRTAALQALPPC